MDHFYKLVVMNLKTSFKASFSIPLKYLRFVTYEVIYFTLLVLCSVGTVGCTVDW
jgi:hypothetical protein